MNFKYFLMKLSCLVLSLSITLSLVMFLFGICNVVMFQNRSFIRNSIINQKTTFISDVSNTFDEMQDDFSVPVDALKLALERGAIDVVAEKASKNFIYSYSTDFTEDEALYNTFAGAIGQYCRENDIDVTDEQVGINSSLAVTVINRELGGTATSGVSIFGLSKNRILAFMIGGSAILFVAAYFLLDFINYGRHRKYSYIGMGIITAGYVMTLIPMYIKKRGYVENFNHCSVDLYNNAINDLYGRIFYIFLIVGLILFVAGAVILIVNYRYFKIKGEKAKAAKESSEQMMNEYIMQYNEKKKLSGKTPTSGRHVMKIDFDDEE